VYENKLLLRQTIPDVDDRHLVICTHCERVAKPLDQSTPGQPKTLRSTAGQWIKPAGTTTSSHMLKHLRDKHGLPTNAEEEDRKRSEHGLPLGKKRNRMAPETAEARMCARYWLEFPELTDEDWAEAKQKEQALLARLEEQDARWLAQSASAADGGIGEIGDTIGDSDGSEDGAGEGHGFSGRGSSGRGSRGAGSGGGAGGAGSGTGSGDESSSLSSLSGDE
jgi:uncharacterized membrane protein YgcG